MSLFACAHVETFIIAADVAAAAFAVPSSPFVICVCVLRL